MDIQQYIIIVRRWIWRVLLGAAIGGAFGLLSGATQTPEYETTTKVMVSSSRGGQAANPYAFYTDSALAKTYVQILTTQPMLDKAGENLGYVISAGQVSASQIDEQTPIIQIKVVDTDPQRAADIANQMVLVLIEQNVSLQSGQYTASEESLQAQITQVEEQIAKLQADLDSQNTKSLSEQIAQVEVQMQPLREEVAQIQQEIAVITPATSTERKVKLVELESRLSEIQPLLSLYQQIYSNLVVLGNPGGAVENNSLIITRLQSTLALYQQIYLNLINSREAIRLARLQNTPNVVQIEKAAVPQSPFRPRPLNNALAGFTVGLLALGGIAFLFEYLDDTLKTAEDVERMLGVPVLGYIADMKDGKKDGYLYVREQPRSPISEAFRSLRINLEFAGVDKPLRTFLVTSPGPGEGKTTVSTNLASIIAQAGRTSILVDADMRRPRVHSQLGISNKRGLSDLFVDHYNLAAVQSDWGLQPNMSVITSGAMPPNPAELLGSEKMLDILESLKDFAEIVVIDSPPTVVADAQSLASKLDGILVVIHPGHTRLGSAVAAVEQFRRVGGNVVGIVFNRISTDNRHYYGGYYHYTYNYYTSQDENIAPDLFASFKQMFQARREKKQPKAVVEAIAAPESEDSMSSILNEKPIPPLKTKQAAKRSSRKNGNGNGHANLKLGVTLGSEHQFRIHRVDDGEKLVNIARAESSSVSAISAVNYNFATPIKAEQLIVIPINQTDASKLPPFEAYESTEEIEVEKLAETLNVDAAKLKYYNGLQDGYRLTQGDWIVVPKTKSAAG